MFARFFCTPTRTMAKSTTAPPLKINGKRWNVERVVQKDPRVCFVVFLLFVFCLCFFFLVFIHMFLFITPIYKTRIASMECIGEIVGALEPPFVAFFLPGIVSALSRVTTGDFKQGQQVTPLKY